LRGRKRSLHDGGVRVPAFAVWPGRIEAGTRSDAVLSTLDYFPTITGVVEYEMPDARPIDGEDVLDILTGHRDERVKPIPFRFISGNSSLVKGRYKLLLPKGELYDLANDRAEQNDLSPSMPARVAEMKDEVVTIFHSIEKSHSGADYNDPSYIPVDPWHPLRAKSEAR
jgi:arylsulfatase A-like enzyme